MNGKRVGTKVHAGFSIMELMIAAALGFVLMVGLSTVYVSSRKAYLVRDELSVMQENARIALEALTHHLEHAGYSTEARLALDKAFYVAGDAPPAQLPCSGGGENMVAPASLRPAADNDAANSGGDATAVMFYTDAVLFSDCAGIPMTAGCRIEESPQAENALMYNTFYVGTPPEENQPNLICASSGGVNPLVEGVEHMQVAYGLDSDGDGGVDQYLDASGVSAAGSWQKVITIKVALLMRSRTEVFPDAQEKTWSLLGVNIVRHDRYQRSVHSRVIYLRNLAEAG